MYKYIFTWIACLIITLFSTLYIKSVANNDIIMAMLSDLIVPLLGVVYYHFLIEEKTIFGKVILALVSGTAYAIGTGLILYFL
jgi:hypothetical protein